MRESNSTVTLFWDKNIPKAIPQVLRKLKVEVTIVRYQEMFQLSNTYPEGGDDNWLNPIGEKNWIVITQDYHFHTRLNELFAIKQHKVGVFYLWGASNTRWEIMKCFARGYDRIIDTINNSTKPFIYRVEQKGHLTQIPI